ncbi:hypothetical protein [Amycolatopsis sp. NBC_01480]|uniref:hypothetical protein n=1 Tax=Amycolatopsis sp. NBC_01480 TaxID=2903562 RepID=UPI002E2E1763|nr:hypothetical protein [Amycolatopsis sp. NBC_01480]
MGNGPRTEFVTECRTRDGGASAVTVAVCADGRFELLAAADLVVLTAEQVARLRTQLGDALTIGLRDARTCRGRSV